MEALRITAWAKVNLTLEVLGRRPDGYHEVRTVMQTISLADELMIVTADDLSLEVADPALRGEGNLVLRAASLLRNATRHEGGALIRLVKGIPVAAGLGGASSDAAAALVGLNELWGLGLGHDELHPIAAAIGSDVPFFIRGGTALATGRGEAIQPLPDAPRMWLVLLASRHDLAAKTAHMYRRLNPEHWTSGQRSSSLARTVAESSELPAASLVNAFDPVAAEVFPALPSLKRAMILAGAPSVHLSGAGPAIFSMFTTEEAALVVQRQLAASGHDALIAHTVPAARARLSPTRGGTA